MRATLALATALGLPLLACAPEPVAPEPVQAALERALSERLEAPATLEIEQSKRRAGWLFACGTPRTPAGDPIDYRKTALRERAAEGTVDAQACALARELPGGGWRVEELAVGDTDAPFVDWPARHGAPASLLDPSG